MKTWSGLWEVVTGRSWSRGLRLLALVGLVVGGGVLAPWHLTQAAGVAITGLHVQGNQIVNNQGQTVRLLGVDRSGTEYACIQGWGIFDGPNDAASVQAIASWHVNAVRVPLNEDCWLAINGAPAAYSGSTYRQAIIDYVNLLNQNGIAAILDLHWNAPGSSQATGQQPMADQDHAPAFWSSVASTFKGNQSVLFDLYNEPYPDNNQDTDAAWQCLRDGGSCPGVGYQAAGMQELVNTVRAAGAPNIIMVGGVQYAGSLSQWLTYKPTDPQNNLAASWHNYNFSICTDTSCWDSQLGPVTQQVPLVTGEMGENDCAHGYIDGVMQWLDAHGASYLGWTWDTWGCTNGPSLIDDYNGTPNNFGVGLKNHLAAITTTNPPPPTNTPAPTSTPTPGSTKLGLTTVGSVQDTNNSNWLDGSRIVVGSQNVTLQSISVYVGAVDAAPHNQYTVAVYADSNGAPGALLAQSGAGTLTANSWNTEPIGAALKANTAYWLLYNSNGTNSAVNNMYYNNVTSNLGAFTSGPQSYGSWPSTFSGTVGPQQYSIYATVSS